MSPTPDPFPHSPVFDRENRIAPKVRQSSSPWTVALALLGAGVVGVLVFSSMSGHRNAHAQAAKPPAPVRNTR